MRRAPGDGAVATQCRYGHLNTETGPGHASLSTGTPPRVHGIALNQWYVPATDGASMETIYCASQPLPGEPDEELGPQLARASIATCQGSRGWDNYLLLHHYDRTFKLDSLPPR